MDPWNNAMHLEVIMLHKETRQNTKVWQIQTQLQ